MALQTSVASMHTAVTQAGQLVDTGPHDIASYVNTEATDEMVFGTMLAQGAGDNDALLMADQGDNLIGVLYYSQAYQRDNELGDTGLKPGVGLNVLKRGRCWVQVSEAVTPDDDVRVNEAGGTFQTTPSAGATTLLVNARWLTSTSGAGLAQVEIDMLTRADNTLD